MDMKYFKGITPKYIDKNIARFCRKISSLSHPVYIDVLPKENCAINDCVNNVKKYVIEHGGEPIYGWAIWLHPHCMIEAEFHVIYKSKDHCLVDITPHKDNDNQILFIEDKKIAYKGSQINNIRQNLSKSKLIDNCIYNWNKIFEIMNKGERKFKHGKLTLSITEVQTIANLQDEITYYLINFYKNLKLKPNDMCICGSNKKYVECCKNKQ
uniref:Uncharacterized protein n=1 Tax=uncultured Candidatus Melainabacteria bacterium TaxID=2682970 RepID=A0A650EJH3_9BACT|nr:hypothetical protein Melaina855_1500 [uncultured Candidatus Melainabacteria bacterium]